jgi:hypothetical protein
MGYIPSRVPPVEPRAGARLMLGLGTAVVIMGCFWYFLFRTLRLIDATAQAGRPMPGSAVEFLAVIALCLFLLGVAEVLPWRSMLTAGLAFLTLDFGGHILFGTTSTLLLHRAPLQYAALALLLAASLQTRRLRLSDRPAA